MRSNLLILLSALAIILGTVIWGIFGLFAATAVVAALGMLISPRIMPVHSALCS